MDFLNDKTGAIIGYAFENSLLPDSIKQASMPTSEEVNGLKDNAFANPFDREYPCHNKQATVLSALYAAASYEDEAVIDGIKKMASAYGIEDITNPIFDHFSEAMEKYAAEKAEEETPMVKFALSLTAEDGTVTNHYNISTKEDTVLAIRHLNDDYSYGAIAPRHMRKIAKEVISAARDFDIAYDYIPSQLTRFVSGNIPDVSISSELAQLRKSANVDIERYDEVIQKLANDMSDSDMSDEAIEACTDVAVNALFDLDQEYNIKYASDQPDPYDIVFSGPSRYEFEKFASNHVRIQGISVPVVDMLNLNDDKIETLFSKQAATLIHEAKDALKGEASVEKTTKSASILENLSQEASTVLLTTLAGTGW